MVSRKKVAPVETLNGQDEGTVWFCGREQRCWRWCHFDVVAGLIFGVDKKDCFKGVTP